MAENRKDKDRRFYFTKGQMVLLGGAFAVASLIVFVLGILIGKEIEARKMVKPEEAFVTVPIQPAPQGAVEADGAKSREDLTFYNTLSKSPAPSEKARERENDKTAKAPIKDKKTPSSAEKASAKAPEKRSEKPAPAAETQAEAAPKGKADTKPDDKAWSVQVNAYPDENSANELVERLKNKGYNAYVAEASNKGKIWYRVRVGRFNSREEAEKIETALKNNENLPKAFATRQ